MSGDAYQDGKPVFDTSLIPVPSVAMPMAEATSGNAGTNPARYSQEGHTHPRLTSTTMTTLDASGSATVTFTRSFSAPPGVVMTEIGTNSQPLVFQVQSYIGSAGNYTGAVIKAYRSSLLPTVSLNLLGFNLFSGSAAGASVSVVAIARSDV